MQNIDKNDFFRTMTLSICSSLDLNVALQRCLRYLETVFPVHGALLSYLNSQLGAFCIVTKVSTGGSKQQFHNTPLTAESYEWVSNTQRILQPTVWTEEIQNLLPPQIQAIVPVEDIKCSKMLLPLVIEEQIVGTLIILAPAGFAYSQKHVELIKPLGEPFAVALSNAIAYQKLIQYQDILLDDRDFLQKELVLDGTIIGEKNGLASVMKMVAQVAGMNNTVLITGETGVGKEVIANAIHQRSKRRNGPFIKVNCGAIPEALVDSELFGYEKGAFTGATSQKRGRFERADGGTIFLDEVGELSLSAQVRLLRVLANREIERVGGNESIPLNIRVIAATHRDLKKMVEAGTFREDLWFRLNVFPIHVPPLRERKEDIPQLAEHFIYAKSREFGKTPPALAPGALEQLTAYDWPGNVRELDNMIERAMISGSHQLLRFDSLSPSQRREGTQIISGKKQTTDWPDALPPLNEAIRRHIVQALDMAKGKISGRGSAAEILQINGSTLRSCMRKHNITGGRTKK